MFDRKVYFDTIRADPFGGSMSQSQVDGQEMILDTWEASPSFTDLRHLAYMLATTYHETAATMQPIEEYGKGKGKDYGVPDKQTGQTYFGRGFVQLTWRSNYAKADAELGFDKDTGMEWHADRALDEGIAAQVMFRGMSEGWFRGDKTGRHTLARYFSNTKDDPVGARNIINGDVSTMGKKIAGYHQNFLDALTDAVMVAPEPPVPEPTAAQVAVRIDVVPGTVVSVLVNGVPATPVTAT